MVDVGTGLKVGEEVVRWAARRGIVKKAFDKVRPKYQVLVVGISGAGKTNFLNSLTEPSARAVARDDRTRFSVAKTLVMPGRSKPFVFHDTPGEDGDGAADERRGTIQSLSRRRGSFGIINVVAYGYLETHRVEPTEALSDGVAKPEYLERQRDLEIGALANWVPLVDPRQVDYVVTLVTKADLWFSKRVDVVNHYANGDYAKAVKTSGVTHHVVIEYASTIHKFFGGSTSGDFDLDNLLRLRDRFQREMINAVSRP